MERIAELEKRLAGYEATKEAVKTPAIDPNLAKRG
jgi:hypothetical protein